jgi:NAD(P)H-dependent FMN reductase
MNIEIISGSPRAASVTHRISLFLQQELQRRTHHEVGVLDVREYDLPLLNSVFSSVQNTPDAFKPLAERIFAADAFILVSPEYNGSYTPAMKNLLDHFPKQARKPFGIVTGSTGSMGGMRATQQMQLLVGALFGILSPYMLVVPFMDKKFDADGNLIDPAFQKQVDTFLNEYLWLAESLQPELVQVMN